MHCPGVNANDPIWRVLAFSDGISSWTPLKPQYSNPKPKPLANQLWSIDFITPHTTLIIPHRLPAFLESLMPLKNWCSIRSRWSKCSLRDYERCGGVRKSIHQSWLAKGLGLLCWGFKGVQKEIPSEEASTLQIWSVTFPAGQCTSSQLHPCHRLFNHDGHQDSSSPSL